MLLYSTPIEENKTPSIPKRELFLLTRQEWKTLLLIADDRKNIDIANQLGIKIKTLRNYRSLIASKLNEGDKDNLGIFARKNRDALYFWFDYLKIEE